MPPPPEADRPVSAIPSRWLRAVVLGAIVVAGGLAAVFGASFASLSCRGDCDLNVGLTMWFSATAAASAVAVVGRIVLRGSDDWRYR